MGFQATVYNRSLVQQGSISTIISARGSESTFGIGRGEVVIPASDTSAVALLLNKKYIVMVRQIFASSSVGVTIFVLDAAEGYLDGDQYVLKASGPELLQELSYRSVGTDPVSDGSLGPSTTPVDDILAHDANWSYNWTTQEPGYLTPNNESVLQALQQYVAQVGQFFVLYQRNTPDRTVWRFDPTAQTPIVIDDNNATSNSKLLGLRANIDSGGVVTRVRVAGGGLGDGALTLKNMTSVTPPTGFSVTPAASLIINTALESSLGVIVEQYQTFPNYRPEDATAAAETAAADALYAAALAWLQAREDETIYTLDVAPTERLIPGFPCTVNYTDPIAGSSSVNGYIHKVDYSLTVEGFKARVTMTTGVDYRPTKGASYLAGVVRNQSETLRHASATTVGTAPSTGDDHGGLDATSLLDDDHPQYLLADGTRALAGNLSVNTGVTIDGVDISVHAANASAHHAPVTAGNGISLSGQQVAVGTPSSNTATSTNTASGTTHTHAIDSTIARSAITITAGSGLTGGGNLTANRTINVGAGAGITVNADDVALNTPGSLTATSTNTATGNHTHAIDSTIARSAITITAGSGLTGGGNLTANRTINVGAGAGITVNADDVALTTPGSLSATSTNTATGNHTHAVTASANPGAAASLLKSTASGGLTLESLSINGSIDVGQDLTVGANVLFVDESAGLVGINCAPDTQFALDVNGNLRAQGWIVGKHALQIADATMICHYDGNMSDPANDFTGVSTGHMGQTATVTGAEVYRAGKFGKAIQIAPSTTNLLVNPSFETGSTGWSTSGSNTIAQSSEQAKYGNYSLKCTYQDNVVLAYEGVTLTASEHTFSVWVYIPSNYDGDVYIVYDSFIGMTGNSHVYADSSITDEWQRISVTATPDAGDLSGVLLIKSDGATAGQYIYIDAAQLEAKGYCTPYCDGDMPGHTWAGTAHNSTSSRTASYLQYDSDEVNVSPTKGSISMWVYLDSANPSGGVLWQLGNANAEFDAYINSAGQLNTRANGSNYLNTPTTAFAGRWTYFTWTWDETYFKAYIDGELVRTVTLTAAPTFHATYYGIGASVLIGSTYVHNGLIDDLAIVDRTLDPDEILAIYESNAPVFAETSTFSWSDPQNTIWVDSEGLFGRDVDGNAIIGLSTVDSKSWGGNTLNKGDLLIGRSGANSILWDNSAGTLTIAGDGDGITNIDGGNIQTGTVTATQINVSQLSAIAADMGSLTAGTITGATIRTASSGARIEMNSTKIYGTDGTTTQWEALASTGQLTAGGGTVTLDENGLSVSVSGTSYLSTEALTFENTGVLQAARDGGGAGYNTMRLATTSRVSGKSDPYIAINSDNSEGTNNAQLENFDYINISSANLKNVESVNFVQIATTTPGTPVTNGANLYVRNNKLIAMYDDSGTIRYKYLDLSGTGVTWVHTTTAP